MADLLLITDIPRLRTLFSRLAKTRSLPLRIAGSLEKGAEEIVAAKPAMVFVQTHLSGLSADILLMHLKKLLGRRRTRFVLLSPADQVNKSVIKLYHNYIDTSLEEQALIDAISLTIDSLNPKGKRPGADQDQEAESAPQPAATEFPDPTSRILEPAEPVKDHSVQESSPEAPIAAHATETESSARVTEPSLEEQGVVYAPRAPLSVYSEFTSRFDSAVSQVSTPEPESFPEEPANEWHRQAFDEKIRLDTSRSRSKSTRYALWLAGLIVVAVAFTLYQHSGSRTNPSGTGTGEENKNAIVISPPTVVEKPSSAPSSRTQDTVKTPPSGSDARMGDAAVMSAIAENRGQPDRKSPSTAPRPTALPDFIPRTGFDREYGVANPGWERYKGVVTEFRVFREQTGIKAIQIIDRGGQGIPEAFMKGVLGQLARTPSLTPSSSEKKEGYEIQRGQIAANLGAVYYRDVQGGKLRAFVVTWQ